MSEASVDRGAHVLRKGDIGDAFYVLKRGRVGVVDDKGALVAELGEGAYFGETAILKDTPRNADVVALEPCGLLKLTRDDFVKLLGPLEDALNAEAERRRADLERSNRLKSGLKNFGNTVAAGFVASRDALRSRARTLKAASVGDDADAAYDDGLGPFGRPGAAHGGTIRVGFRAAGCALVRDDSGGCYTLRIVSKRKVFAKSWDQGLLRERAILTSKIGESPFVARCLATGSNRANTSRRVVLAAGHDHAVDLWALGVLVFELVSRRALFARSGDTPARLFARVVDPGKTLKSVWSATSNYAALVTGLVKPRPAERLGAKHDGFAELWDHKFFRHASLDGVGRATALGWEILTSNGSAVDAVEAAVRYLEEDPAFDAGRGAVLTSAGTVELDAVIMDGRDLSAGAVASLGPVLNPVSVARAVMERSEHVLLCGAGADAFAREIGVEALSADDLVTAAAREEYEQMKTYPTTVETLFNARAQLGHDTVGAVAVDGDGSVAGGLRAMLDRLGGCGGAVCVDATGAPGIAFSTERMAWGYRSAGSGGVRHGVDRDAGAADVFVVDPVKGAVWAD
ncbi:beta-aspartyl-peptidase [Aureococcus anophagefferens]|nr:beta-aspartyl-peptidase [Aureococcus anophagefferens]